MLAEILSVICLTVVSSVSGFLYYKNIQLKRLLTLHDSFLLYDKRLKELEQDVGKLSNDVSHIRLRPRSDTGDSVIF